MAVNRIVSLLPSATELVYALGVQDKLYGVTHQCRYPNDALLKPKVVNSVIDAEKLTSKEIDIATCKLLEEGKEIFVLHEKNMIDARPELIISQNTCNVCAPYQDIVDKAVRLLDKEPIVLSMDPHNITEILNSVIELGDILDRNIQAVGIVRSLEEQIRQVKRSHKEKPRVLAIEWIEPFFTAGHWVPEMIQIAGGISVKSNTGTRSSRLDINEIVQQDPEIIILMPCGFDTQRTVSEYNKILRHNALWNTLNAVKNDNVFAVDANSFFSKPSIRTIQGIEILAKIIHPKEFRGLQVPKNSFVRIKNNA